MIIIGLIIGGIVGYLTGTMLAIGQIDDLYADNMRLTDEIKRLRKENDDDYYEID